MQAYRLETTVEKAGRIDLTRVPFAEGEPVEVIVSEMTPSVHEEPAAYPSREEPGACQSPGVPQSGGGAALEGEEAMMQAVRIETTVRAGGKVILERLPFREGDRVAVTVVERPAPATVGEAHPYWGKPYRYDRPTDPVAEDDWELLR